LFDSAKDPGELHSVAADPSYRDRFDFLRHQIEWFRTTHAESFWNY
jgi:hypothetical protein